MPRGNAYSADLASTIMRLTASMSDKEITERTGVPERTIRRMRKRFVETGLPTPAPHAARREQPQRRILSIADLEYIWGRLEQSCDLYLDELQAGLARQRGVEKVSLSTIWRALDREGYTLKKVCASLEIHSCFALIAPP
jgi:transposase